MSEEEKTIQIDDAELAAVEIRSEEVQEIMGYIPHWMIRWGITLLFAVIVVFFIGSWFFKYPDVIQSTITVTTKRPPASIMARTTGKINQLFVTDNQKVGKDQTIALLDNASNYEHLLELKEKLDALKDLAPHYDMDGVIRFEKNYSLGQLQTSYSSFSTSYRDFTHFIQLDYHNKKINALNLQMEKYQLLYKKAQRQLSIVEEEYKLSKEKFQRSQTLYKDGVISRSEFDNARSNFLQQEYSLEGSRSSLASNRIQISQLEQSILDLTLQYREQKTRLELSLNQAYANLMAQISQWEQSFLLKSPISGTAAFTKFWSTNQNVMVGDLVFTVIPEDAGEMLGKVVLPVQGSGKVKVGQKVNIKFFNYPHVDFGMVRGIIRSKSLVASDNNYVLEVALPDGLRTNYKEDLVFSQEMMGTAEIITEDMRLLERVIKPLQSVLKQM